MKLRRELSTVVCEALLCFVCLFYPHMDANMFWSDPISYFSTCGYGHNFIFSTQCGLIWMLVPLFAYISHKSEIKNNKNNFFSWKECGKIVVDFFIFFSIFVCILAVFSKRTIEESSWQSVARNHAYSNLATNDNMALFTLFVYLQLAINLFLWIIIVKILEEMFKNNSLVFIGVMAISYMWHSFGVYEWNYSVWMISPVGGDISLVKLVTNNLIILSVGVAILFFIKHISLKSKISGDGGNYILHNYKETIITFVLCFLTPILLNAGFNDIFSPSNSITNIWVKVFGGIEWGDPDIVTEYAYRGVACVLIPFIYDDKTSNNTYINKKENSNYFKVILLRMLGYMFCCVLIQMFVILKNKTTTTLLFYSDISLLQWVCFSLIFLAHVTILHNVYLIVYKLTRSSRISQLIWLLPFLGTLLASNEDRMINVFIPTNWSMVIRSDMFSPSYVIELMADGSEKMYKLATFPVINALLGEALMLVMSMIILKMLNVKQPISIEKKKEVAQRDV